MQWQTDLQSKFNEGFTTADGPTTKVLAKGGANPWTQVDNASTSLNLVMGEKHAGSVVEAGWDLVIFDEAHSGAPDAAFRGRPSQSRVWLGR